MRISTFYNKNHLETWGKYLHAKFLEKSPMYRGSQPFAPGTRWNHGGPIYSLRSWRSHPGIKDDQFTP